MELASLQATKANGALHPKQALDQDCRSCQLQAKSKQLNWQERSASYQLLLLPLVACRPVLTLRMPKATLLRLGMLAEPTRASASTLILLYSTVTSGSCTPGDTIVRPSQPFCRAGKSMHADNTYRGKAYQPLEYDVPSARRKAPSHRFPS